MFTSRYLTKILIVYLAYVGIVFLMPYASVNEVQAAEHTVKVGVYDNAPISYPDENGKYRGLSIEILEHIADQEGWTLEYVPGTWAECLERLTKGEIDLQVYIAVSEERKRLFDFNNVNLMSNWAVVYISPDREITSLFDLGGKKLATLKKGIHTTAIVNLIQKFSINVELIKFDTNKEVLRSVESKQADAGIVNRIFALVEATKYNVTRTPIVFNPIEIGYAAPKGRNPGLLLSIDTHLRNLKKDKDSIYHRIFENTFYAQPKISDHKWLWRILVGLGVMLGGAIIIILIFRYQVDRKTQSLVVANKSLQDSEERNRSIVEGALDAIISVDKRGNITEFNSAAIRMFGYDSNQAIDKKVSTLIVPERYRERHENAFQHYLKTGEGSWLGKTVKIEAIRSDGTEFPVELSLSSIGTTRGEICTATIRDITERLQLENQLRQAQKMESIGQLTGGIAHDFNNMLGVIMGNLDLLHREVTDDPKNSAFIEAAYKGCQRGADITRKLLSFARQESGTPEKINVNDFIEDMEDLIAKALTVKIAVEAHLADDLWEVSTDAGEFEDTLINLSLNARDAMSDGGTLVIETTNKIIDEHYVRLNPGSTTGDHVMISISDTGCGMTSKTIGQVFEPFFTTKELGKGTGLGLSMVYGFVKRSNGYIKIYSEPDKGTTVRMYLPKTIEGTETKEAIYNGLDDELLGGDETILVVDDEEGLLKVAVSYLEELGYKTQTATNGKQALKVLQEQHDIDLLFSDVVMPGDMDGYDLGKEVMKNHPDIKVLLTSGFTAKRESPVDGDVALFDKFSNNLLGKPYNQAELAKAVRQILDEED